MNPTSLIKNKCYYYHYEGKVEKVEYVKHTLNHRVFQSDIYTHILSENTVNSLIHEII